MKQEIEFKCPECEYDLLAMVVDTKEMIETNTIETDEAAEWFLPGETLESLSGDVMDFVCASCGFSIGSHASSAADWLDEHGMIGESYP